MKRRYISVLMFAACAIGVQACNQSPTSPSPPALSPPAVAAPAPAASGVTNWTVTHRFASVTGPDNCWVREQRARLTGVVFSDLPMRVTRSGGSITLDSPFFDAYSGTVSGNDFLSSGGPPLPPGGRPCQDGTSFQQSAGVSNLSGRISADEQSLIANEVNSYTLNTGEAVSYVWEWVATRR